MEKEELQWRLKLVMEVNALLSTMSDSSSEILDKLSHDKSLLKCPVRMSVFLNELDTSQTEGGRGSGSHRQVTAWERPPNRVSSRKNCNYSGRPSTESAPFTPTAKKIRYSKQPDSVNGTPKQSHSNKSLTQERDRNDNSSVTEALDDQGTRKGHIENDEQT
ncbi:uncharacterized protein LOC143222807 [Tachypleus tridentatus]|uniref:uncharacterized protein LOC143222807 n=1 Tax=Tachypleus tridentatus TaxID=6853 RepID=UPI003FD13EAB